MTELAIGAGALLCVVLAIVAVASTHRANEEREGSRFIQREFREFLRQELERAQLRHAQLELMLDSRRSAELGILTPEARDEHLLVSAPSLRAPGSAAVGGAPIHSLEGSVDALPPILRDEVRAIESDADQREYLETIQRELAGGADPVELHARLFGV